MVSDNLYKAGFKFRDMKIWEKIKDNQLFAVSMDDGETGFVSIMGGAGDYCALSLYVGEKGFRSFQNLARFNPQMNTSYFVQQETMLSQDCLNIAIDSMAGLEADELNDINKYCDANDIPFSSEYTYPQFRKYEPNRIPWRITDEKDDNYLCQALEATASLAELLEKSTAEELKITSADADTKKVPLMIRKGDSYVLDGDIVLPENGEPEYVAPACADSEVIEKIKELKNKVKLECEVVLFPEPMQEDASEAPFFAHTLLAVDQKSKFALPPELVRDYEEHADLMVEHFADVVLEYNFNPEEIIVRDKRTYALLEKTAEALGVKISIGDELLSLDEAEYEIMTSMGSTPENNESEMYMLIDAILQMDDEQIKTLVSDELIYQLKQMIDSGQIPEKIVESLKEKIDFNKPLN